MPKVLTRHAPRYRGKFDEFVKKPPDRHAVVRTVNTWTPYCTTANPKLSGPPKDRRPKHVDLSPWQVSPSELDLGVFSR